MWLVSSQLNEGTVVDWILKLGRSPHIMRPLPVVMVVAVVDAEQKLLVVACGWIYVREKVRVLVCVYVWKWRGAGEGMSK